MKRLILIFMSLFFFGQLFAQQAPVVTYPTNGQVNLPLKFTITATSNSTGNSNTSKDVIYIELSKDVSFNPAQGSPDYQKSGNWLKSHNNLLTMNWNFSGALTLATTYYVRAVSSKYGSSAIISFTTADPPHFVTNPTNGQTDMPLQFTIQGTSNSTGNSSNSKDVLYFELSKDISFNSGQGSPNYQKSGSWIKTNDNPLNMNWNFSGALTYATTYYVRLVSSKWGPSVVVSFTTIPVPAPTLILVDGINPAVNPYANQLNTPLTSSTVNGATQYNWQFDIEGDFASPEYSTSTPTNILNLNALTLLSGQAYYVRLQAVIASIPASSNWNSSTPVLFYNALHPLSLTSPGDTSTTRSFKLWTNEISNASDYIFQVDDDKNFGSPYSNPAPVDYLNSTASGISGNVFYANLTSGGLKGFDYVRNLSDQTKYYVRVLARNVNQSGYWGNIDSVFINLPPRANTITNITNGQTGVGVSFTFGISNDPNYDETNFDLQVSEDPTFNTVNFNIQNFTTFSQAVTGMKYLTTYYVRVRSYINNSYPANPGAWSTPKSFTTIDLIVNVTTPTQGQILSSLTTTMWATQRPNVTSYDWEVEKISPPTSSYSKTTATRSTKFDEYLVAGQSYRIRVRATASGQPITGPWSAWVNFSTSAGAKMGLPFISTNSSSDAINAYPNPFENACLVSLTEDEGESVVIVYNQIGEKIEEFNIYASQPFEVGHHWEKGLYIVNITNSRGSRSFKVIKK